MLSGWEDAWTRLTKALASGRRTPSSRTRTFSATRAALGTTATLPGSTSPNPSLGQACSRSMAERCHAAGTGPVAVAPGAVASTRQTTAAGASNRDPCTASPPVSSDLHAGDASSNGSTVLARFLRGRGAASVQIDELGVSASALQPPPAGQRAWLVHREVPCCGIRERRCREGDPALSIIV